MTELQKGCEIEELNEPCQDGYIKTVSPTIGAVADFCCTGECICDSCRYNGKLYEVGH